MTTSTTPQSPLPQLVGVCGSGIMGSGLAEVVARAGINVVVRSRTIAGAQSMLTSVENNLAKQVAKAKMTEDQRTEILSHISITDQLTSALPTNFLRLQIVTLLSNQSSGNLHQSKNCFRNSTKSSSHQQSLPPTPAHCQSLQWHRQRTVQTQFVAFTFSIQQ